MSHPELEHHVHGAPTLEPWLKVTFLALVPALLGVFVPHAYRPACFIAAGVVVAVGMLMLVTQVRRAAIRPQVHQARENKEAA